MKGNGSSAQVEERSDTGACVRNESESGREGTAVRTEAEGNGSEGHRKRLELEKEPDRASSVR